MSGRLALTGVSRGIGSALGQLALDKGWELEAFGRGQAPSWLEGRGAFHHCDMADPSAVRAAGERLQGPLDVLICNAATFGGDAFHLHDFSDTAFAQAFIVNVVSPVRLAATLKPQIEEGRHKLVIFMSTGNASLSGNTEGSMLAYRTSKSALNQAMRNVAADWGKAGITTVALNPGWVRTDMGGPNAPTSPEDAAADILNFIDEVARPELNGTFINPDGSPLPW